MMKRSKFGWKLWEIALLILLSWVLLGGAWAERTQEQVADQVVRLHVLASSDEAEDQALKLQVRDAVLCRAEALLAGCEERTQALAVLSAHLEDFAQAGAAVVAEAGYDDPVTVRLERCAFPTKVYDGFALPAGEYTALRVLIGAGGGRNWWCVLYPELCLAPAVDWAETARAGGVEEDTIALMEGKCQVKFKAVELWGRLKAFLTDEVF